MSTPLVIPSVFTAIDKFSAPMKRMTSNMEAFAARSQRALNWANQGFNKLVAPITSMNNMLSGLGFYVGLYGLVRVVKNAIDIFSDFQQANTDLSIVMGLTVKQNKVLADEARMIGLNYGVAATEVVKMQHALATLGFEQADILKMGRPLITGSSALEGANPERLAETVGAAINAFDKLTPANTQHILDVMALASNRTALNFEKLATTIPIVSGPANAINVQFEEMIALLGVLQNSGIHVATSATSLKNIFIDTKNHGGKGYVAFLENVIKHVDKLTFANKKVGKRSVVSALSLATHLHDEKNGVIALTKEFENATSGLTELMATERLNTFQGAQKLLNASWKEFVLSIEDGTGPIAQSLTRIVKVASAVLLLSSDSDAAREAIKKLDGGILESARSWQSWLKWIGYVAGALIALKVLMIAYSIVIGTLTAAVTAYNIAAGIMAAVTGAASVSISSGTAYIVAYRIALAATTGAQWLFQQAIVATSALPFIGTIGLMVLAVKELDNTLFKALQRWNDLNKASEFQKRGIDYQKMQNESFWERLYKFPTRLLNPNHDISSEENKTPIINPKATEQQNLLQMIQQGNIAVDFSNVPVGTNIKSSAPNIMPKVKSTSDAYFLNPSY